MPPARTRLPSSARALLFLSCALACRPQEATTTPPPSVQSAPPAPPIVSQIDTSEVMNRIARLDFNRRAVELNQPLFWRSDDNHDGVLQPRELAVTWSHTAHTAAEFVADDAHFTPRFLELYRRMQEPARFSGFDEREQKRQRALSLELAQGRPTLIETDFSATSAPDKALAVHLERVAMLIERLYGEQRGSNRLEAKLVAGDAPSAALFFRNQGPFCVAPKTERDEDCSALPERPKPSFGLYPAALQTDPKFCDTLGKQKNGPALLDHFNTVVEGDAPNTFKAVPYPRAYPSEMSAVADELARAAADLPAATELALKAYLTAAARAFLDNDWEPANRAWVAMNAHNSKYYLRVGPDEVYYEPCASKAGFALAFARINPDSVAWQEKLEPIKQEFENDLARLAGPPYRARQVAFKLPDFIDIVLDAGDNRMAFGATAGQSLPNWGPVAESGGRTVTMTNIATDPDSQQALSEQMKAMYCKTTMAQAVVDPKSPIMGVVLHEATHNYGPAHDYKVNGKTDSVIFGGPLASTLEELKAENGALYFARALVARNLISERDEQIATLSFVGWAFGHVAQGMYDAQGRPKNYSQLAAIQLGSLQEAGALEWKAHELAANGTDNGCMEVHFDKWGSAVTDLTRVVARIKARGDKPGAEQLKAKWVDSEGDFKSLRAVVAERWLRAPKASFVYSLTGL
ncbi:MAG: hypothetical protein ABW061_00440 [Polyangiaceae bacterium]